MNRNIKEPTESISARITVEKKEKLRKKYPDNSISEILSSLVNRLLEGKIIGFKVEPQS